MHRFRPSDRHFHDANSNGYLSGQCERDLLTRIIQSLPEQQAAAGTTWWDIPEDYQERLYGTRDAVVGTLAALAASLKVAGPVDQA